MQQQTSRGVNLRPLRAGDWFLCNGRRYNIETINGQEVFARREADQHTMSTSLYSLECVRRNQGKGPEELCECADHMATTRYQLNEHAWFPRLLNEISFPEEVLYGR